MEIKEQTKLYDSDFHAWCFDQVSFLERKELEKVDWENLIQEIISMGGSERQELENRLTILFTHLLKWIYQKDFRSNSWKLTIREQRKRVLRRIKNSPSLKNVLPNLVKDAYEYSIFVSIKETGLQENIFPKEMPFTIQQALEENWMPE